MENNTDGENLIIDFVKGDTQVLGLIGDPVTHSRSPALHNTIAANLQSNTVYVPFPVKGENLEDAIKGAFALGITGLNVTIPHKKAVLPFLVGVSPEVEKVGAANTLKRVEKGFFGYNTDIQGIKDVFVSNRYSVEGKVCAVLGAGGGAYAAAFALADLGAAEVAILNRTLDNAEALAERIEKNYDIKARALQLDMAEVISPQVCIQATAVGFGKYEGQSPVPAENKQFFRKLEFAFDEIYIPEETEFLKIAKEYAGTLVNGVSMLTCQAMRSYAIFTGLKGLVEE